MLTNLKVTALDLKGLDKDLRQTVQTFCLKLSRQENAPIGYWMEMPLNLLMIWIELINKNPVKEE